jgi:hypothetical protein
MDYSRCTNDVRQILNTWFVAKSDFPIHGILGYIVNNWEFAPLIKAYSGQPINITQGSDESLTDVGNDRPNLIPGVNPINYTTIRSNNGNATYATRSYLNQAAFALNTVPGTYGNLGRNAINGPMLFDNDAQISRIFPIEGRISIDARIEAFNALNHPSFSNPSSSNPSSGSFGEITGTSNGARIFQGGLKVIF